MRASSTAWIREQCRGAFWVGWLALCASAGAQDLDKLVKFETLEYVITPAHCRAMCDAAALTEYERQGVEKLYNTYWPRAMSLDQQSSEAMAETGRERLEEMYDDLIAMQLSSSLGDAPSDDRLRLEAEIGELKHDVALARWRFMNRSDALVTEFFSRCQLEAGLTPEQSASMERCLRRRVFFWLASQGSGDLRLAIDLNETLSELLGPEGVLSEIPFSESDRAAIADARFRYEISLDVLLRDRWRAASERPTVGKPVYRPTDPEFHKHREDAADRTESLWLIQNRLVDVVFHVIRPVDPGAADYWVTAVYSQMCPTLYREFPSTTIIEWVRELDLPTDKLAQIERLHEDFVRRHKQLRNTAFETGVRVQCDPDARFGAVAMDELNLRYAQDLFAIHEAGARYLASVKAFLNPDQRQALRDHLRGERGRSAMRLLGPMIDSSVIQALGIEEEYSQIRDGSFLD